jgi:hypothetical protein
MIPDLETTGFKPVMLGSMNEQYKKRFSHSRICLLSYMDFLLAILYVHYPSATSPKITSGMAPKQPLPMATAKPTPDNPRTDCDPLERFSVPHEISDTFTSSHPIVHTGNRQHLRLPRLKRFNGIPRIEPQSAEKEVRKPHRCLSATP